MGKSSSKVRPLVKERWDNERFVVRFNITEVEDIDSEGKACGVKYEYEEVLVSVVDRKHIIEALIARKYDTSEEIKLAFAREKDKAEIDAHESYVVECKAIADEILANE